MGTCLRRFVFMASTSCGGQAIMLSCWVSEGYNRIRTTSSSTTNSAEFYPAFVRIASHVTRNISRWSHRFSLYSWIIFLMWNRAVISMWDAAGFLFCMREKSSAKLRYSIITQPLVLFNAIKIEYYISEAISSLTCLFFENWQNSLADEHINT